MNFFCINVTAKNTLPFTDENLAVRLNSREHRVLCSVLQNGWHFTVWHVNARRPESVKMPTAALKNCHRLSPGNCCIPGAQSLIKPIYAQQKMKTELL